MKLIHTSDIHLYSPLSSKLPPAAAKKRRAELLSGFSRLCEEAARIGAEGVIIAGDLFDSDRVGKREAETVLGFIERAKPITFLYLPGNHEADALISSGAKIPDNLKIFGKSWTSFTLGGINVVGRTENSEKMFDELALKEHEINVAVLHGELRDRSRDGAIGVKDAAGKFIDYLALGHYHTYSSTKIDERGVAVYSGTPEGRGFDEIGELGYSLVTVEEGVSHRFVPFAKRTLIEYEVDISGAQSALDVLRRVENGATRIDSQSIVRARFVGARPLELKYDAELIEENMKGKFFYFEIKDKSRIAARAEDFLTDKSLKGEFIRLALADGELSEEERREIIYVGLCALRGEEIE